MVFRWSLLIFLLLFSWASARSQQLSGAISGILPVPDRIYLYDTQGAEHKRIDSTLVDRKGRFNFPRKHILTGFYQLAISDQDRADLILNVREPLVIINFQGSPLQEHVRVLRSDENTRLWEYKLASRSAQEQLAAINKQRLEVDPFDLGALARLDSAASAVGDRRTQTQDRLIGMAPQSYFAQVLTTDRRLNQAAGKGSAAIASAMDWTNASLVRSSVHTRAVLLYIQSIPLDDPMGLQNGADSLLHWSRADTICWRATRSLLIRIFDQYGPDELAQYLVERYAVGADALLGTEAQLSEVVAGRARVMVGARVQNLLLPDPVAGDTAALQDLLANKRMTALFIYSSNCDHCHDQMPGLVDLWTRYKDNGLGIVGLALDDDRTEFSSTLLAMGLAWPSYSELRGWGSPAAKALNIKATPTLIVLDSNGTILARPNDHQELREFVEQQLR